MKKIITLFQRNYDGDHLVRDEVVPGAEWVLAGEGVATRKWDGTCCLVREGRLYKRYDVKRGKTPPVGWEPSQPEADPVTEHWPGWLAVSEGPDDRWHREAWETQKEELRDGTYELVGPKVQGNPEGYQIHLLIMHGVHQFADEAAPPRTFEALKSWLRSLDIEGIVWHHPDGRMVKIKKRDFGLKRKEQSETNDPQPSESQIPNPAGPSVVVPEGVDIDPSGSGVRDIGSVRDLAELEESK